MIASRLAPPPPPWRDGALWLVGLALVWTAGGLLLLVLWFFA